MTDTATTLLDEVQSCHDDDPARAAGLLRRIAPSDLAPERWPGYAFLLNHALGEKRGAWPEAHAMFGPLLQVAGTQVPQALWRQAATAALLAGDAAQAPRLRDGLAAAAGVAQDQAQDVVALTATAFRLPTLPWAAAVDAAAAALRGLSAASWQAAGPLDAAVAVCTNNIASSLLERPAQELKHETLRTTLAVAAQIAERFWLRAGTWVHHERAAYLRAMVANALGDAPQAREHALRGLALLDANDNAQAERVDRAFIELERARACRDLALADEARTAQETADALAAQFNDAGLDAWFARRCSELGAPARGVT